MTTKSDLTGPKLVSSSPHIDNETYEHLYTTRAISEAMFQLVASEHFDELADSSRLTLMDRLDTALREVADALEKYRLEAGKS